MAIMHSFLPHTQLFFLVTVRICMHAIRVDKALASYTSHMAVYDAMQA